MTNADSGSEFTPEEHHDKEDWTVREGMDVFSYDGEKLGEVANATGNYVLVRHGFLFTKEYYVPADAIANVGRDAVYLTMTKQIALEQEWDKPPTAETDPHAKASVVTGSAAQVDAETAEPQTGTFSAPHHMSNETSMDAEMGTFEDPRSGTQSVSTVDATADAEAAAEALNDAEITNAAQRTLSAEDAIPVTDEAKQISRLPHDDPQGADEPIPGDANPEDVDVDGERRDAV